MGDSAEDWRGSVLESLRSQRRNIHANYAKVFAAYAEVMDKLVALRAANERLRKDGSSSGGGEVSGDSEELRQQLDDVVRKKAANDQALIETKSRLEEAQATIDSLKNGLAEAREEADVLRNRNRSLESEMESTRTSSQLLRDEHLALQTTCSGLEAKNRELEEELSKLIQRWKEEKEREVDALNAEVEAAARRNRAETQRRLAAAGERRVPILDTETEAFEASEALRLAAASVPSRCKHRFEAHENEVYALKWSPSGKRLASGGADRKLKIWELHENGRQDKVSSLTGSNQALTCLDWDADEQQILGASNDFTSRVWTVADGRCRHTLNGHSAKCLAAHFIQRSTQVVSGSHDRTLKQWDLRAARCLRTLFVGSACNDLVAADDRAIISGHFDKKLRFWDLRAESASNEVLLGGKITSVSLSADGNSLLASTRNDSLALIDLRTNSLLHTYAGESFRVGFDFTRAALSHDGSYAACGSADGSVFVWNVETTKIEKILSSRQAHGDKGVIAVAWHPAGSGLASADKAKVICFWSDY